MLRLERMIKIIQEDFVYLNTLYNYKNELQKSIDKINNRIREIENECDHRYPNGKNAIKSFSTFWECKICGRGQ